MKMQQKKSKKNKDYYQRKTIIENTKEKIMISNKNKT